MQRLPVTNPCSTSWETMSGSERSRRCDRCERDVHNLSAMTEAEAKAIVLIFGAEGLCVRYEQDESGEIVHAEPARVSASLQRAPSASSLRAPAGLFAAALGAFACAPAAPVAPPPETASAAHPIAAADVEPHEASPVRSGGPSGGAIASPAASSPPAAPSPPADTDGDGIADTADVCPTTPGQASTDPSKNGCPQRVVVVTMGGAGSVIQAIRFQYGDRTVPKNANLLLDEVAKVMQEHPEIVRVAVEGHASMDERSPKKLSEARAKAVIDALVARKVDPARLVAESQGAERPLADNATKAGRETNRRVQFRVLDQTGCPAPGGA